MENTTLTISFTALFLTLILSPRRAWIVFCAVLLLYPQPLTVSIGTVDFSSGRIVILGVLANALFIGRTWRRMRFDWMDLLVLLFFITETISYAMAAPSDIVFENRGGVFYDRVFPYFAVRMILHTREDILYFFRWLTILAVPMAIASFYESLTGVNAFGFALRYYNWGLSEADPAGYIRLGFHRATSTFGNYIALGLFFSAVIPLCTSLWTYIDPKKRSRLMFCLFALGLGVFSSLSSAPFFSFLTSMGLLSLFFIRRFWVFPVGAFVMLMAFVEAYSNRHFYEVLTSFALDPATAYYRIGLINEALGGGMKDHWLYGYGYVGIGPGSINNETFHWVHKDFTNIYIGYLATTGLVGLIPYLLINVLYYVRLVQSYLAARELNEKWLVWCFAVLMISWNIAMMTVAPVSQTNQLLHIFIALCCNLRYSFGQVEVPHVHRHFRASWLAQWRASHA